MKVRSCFLNYFTQYVKEFIHKQATLKDSTPLCVSLFGANSENNGTVWASYLFYS